MPVSAIHNDSEPSPSGSGHSPNRTTHQPSIPTSFSPSFFFSSDAGCYPVMSIKSLLPTPPAWTEATCPGSGGGGPDKYDAFFPTKKRFHPDHAPSQSDGQHDDDYDENGRVISTRPQATKRKFSWAASSVADTSPVPYDIPTIATPTDETQPVYFPTPSTSPSPSPSLISHQKRGGQQSATSSPTPSIRQHRSSSSLTPPMPPSTIAKEPLPIRRQGSGAELTPIFECKMAECDGARKARLAREEAERNRRITGLDGPNSASSDGGQPSRAERKVRDWDNGGETSGIPVPGFEMIPATVPSTVVNDEEENRAARRDKDEAKVKRKARPVGKNSTPVVTEKRTSGSKTPAPLEDPFVVAVFLLVVLACPPLGVYVVLREVDTRGHHAGMVLLATLLWVCGVIPGIIFAVTVLFRYLPAGPGENARQKGGSGSASASARGSPGGSGEKVKPEAQTG